jgi:hypothetical protein
MKKLKLSLDDIQVSGFEVVAPDEDRMKTVEAAEALTRFSYCEQLTCIC